MPTIKYISPEIESQTNVVCNGKNLMASVVGVSQDWQSIFSYNMDAGSFFSHQDVENAALVCVIGTDMKFSLFGHTNPIGSFIRIGQTLLKIIGVLKPQGSDKSAKDFGIAQVNNTVIVPFTTYLFSIDNRFRDQFDQYVPFCATRQTKLLYMLKMLQK
ncbi:MAG: ABC transporter permease [Bacteroidales bacterium]|nr:ABC transporter permease [Bacteroidales bacterium]